MKLLNEYKNGNYTVSIYEDGTKVRETEDDEFVAEFPENIDIKISNKCNLGCKFCHENSTPEGKNAKFDQEFLQSLRRGTELAIGGGNIFENPQLQKFLSFCKSRGIIANITINQSHAYEIDGYFTSELEVLAGRGLLNGIGISYNGNADELISFYEWCYDRELININNIVIHVINGVHSYDDIVKLANKGYKLLILGYKDVRNGIEFRNNFDDKIRFNQKSLYDNIHEISKSFKVLSFDNLAIEQLNIRRMFTTEEWEEFYMGDDAKHTMYIDLVEEKFSPNSCATNYRKDLLSNIDEMFKIVKVDGVEFLKGEND